MDLHFIHCLSADEHLDCFHFGAIVNNAAVRAAYKFLCEHGFSILSDIYLGVELMDHIVTLTFSLHALSPICLSILFLFIY
jgi:hypothetical protein